MRRVFECFVGNAKPKGKPLLRAMGGVRLSGKFNEALVFQSGLRLLALELPIMLRLLFPLFVIAICHGDILADIKTAYVGTYTGAESQGIYAISFDDESGEIKLLGLAAETANPSFLAVHKNGKYVYAVNESGDGGLSAFRRNEADFRLEPINQKPSGGGAPCHLVVDETGKNLLVANYSGGSVSVTRINLKDGSLTEQSAFVQHKGSGVDKKRQTAPHAHSINLVPGNKWAVVADLGMDQLITYAFSAKRGTLKKSSVTKLKPGAGPRHFAMNPNGEYAYCINEMHSTVSVFQCRRKTGKFEEIQTLPTLPRDFEGKSSTAEIRVSKDGRFVYGSNRGHDSIAVFRVGADNLLTLIQIQALGGKTPRNFNLDPSGRFLLAAAQQSNKIFVFAVDSQTGKLSASKQSVDVPSPVCIRFAD